jgi:hypothetical protein
VVSRSLSITQNWPGASLSGAWRAVSRVRGKFPGAPQSYLYF